MKYVAIDIETTGLNPETCQILEIGAIAMDGGREVSRFQRVVKWDQIIGEPYALHMNAALLDPSIRGDYLDDVKRQWAEWYANYCTWLVVGKNFTGFDQKFLDRALIVTNYRVLDIGSLVWLDQLSKGNELSKVPSLEGCKKLYKINGPVLHRAIDDCYDYVQLMGQLVLRNF